MPKDQLLMEEMTAYELYNALRATRQHATFIPIKEIAKQIKIALDEEETKALIRELQN